MMRRKSAITLSIVFGLIFFYRPVQSKAGLGLANSVTTADPDIRRTLEMMSKTVSMPYNESVRKMINYYLSSQKGRFSRMLGLSQYYFPIYEKIFVERGVPEEIKYLSIVESSLNPYATSTAQAGGLWQFLTPVGKIYGLAINDSIDERRDPVLACNAAASYLLESYEMYGDWLLAIASYNCGRNNIRWAMEKAPGATDYWALRQYLPVETQNYVPAYIATAYLMKNGRKHGISPSSPSFSIYTREIMVHRPVSLLSIANAVHVDIDELAILNAAYKNQVINGSLSCPKKLVLPAVKDYLHDALAVVLKQPGKLSESLNLVYTIPVEHHHVRVDLSGKSAQPYKAKDTYISYRVQPGDTLYSIVEKFNATEEEVKVLNKLKHYSVKPGMVLKIIQG